MTQALIDAAKAPLIAYNEKNWNNAVAVMTAGFVYDEVATHRRLEGTGAVIEAWQGWAKAFPDSRATFHSAHVAGNKVILELTWNGTHTGPMLSAQGEIPATNKAMEMRACVVSTIENGKVASQTQYFDMATMLQQLGLA